MIGAAKFLMATVGGSAVPLPPTTWSALPRYLGFDSSYGAVLHAAFTENPAPNGCWMFLMTNGHIVRSMDNLQTFQDMGLVSISPNNTTKLASNGVDTFACGSRSGTINGLFVTKDYGTTFTNNLAFNGTGDVMGVFGVGSEWVVTAGTAAYSSSDNLSTITEEQAVGTSAQCTIITGDGSSFVGDNNSGGRLWKKPYGGSYSLSADWSANVGDDAVYAAGDGDLAFFSLGFANTNIAVSTDNGSSFVLKDQGFYGLSARVATDGYNTLAVGNKSGSTGLTGASLSTDNFDSYSSVTTNSGDPNVVHKACCTDKKGLWFIATSAGYCAKGGN